MTEPVPNPLIALSAALADRVAAAADGLVAVQARRSLASGFAWRPDLVVTADEALPEDGEVAVALPQGERRAATIVGRDPSTDVALLRVPGADLAPFAAAADPVRAGSLVIAVGAGEDGPLAALGLVAASGPAWRSMRGGEIARRIELDLRLRRRAEGGAVLDPQGGFLGMAVFGPRRRALVITAATIERVAGQLERHGHVPRGYLGLGLQPVRTDGAGEARAAMVMSVDAQGPGAAAGFRQGDVLVSWDGEPLPHLRALLRGLGPESVGTAVRIGLRRGGEPLELALTVGERPRG